MKIAVSSTGRTLDSMVDPRFGRCMYFLVVETEDMAFWAMDNQSNSLGGGAGIQSAQRLAQQDVQAVLTGNCGPNAHKTLTAAGLDIYVGCQGTVAEVIEWLKNGDLQRAQGPNVASHAGMAQGGH